VLDTLKTPCHPRQYEFSRLNLSFTVMSKRKLLDLVQGGHVAGWDDPRMPTLQGLRRRGFTPGSIRDFCEKVGVTKKEGFIEMGFLELCLREDLDRNAPRAMAVLRPLKVVIENYPEGEIQELDVANHPNRPEFGTRKIPFSRVIYIEEDDFMENPPGKFFRLAPGREVRLRAAFFIKCEKAIKDSAGKVTELRCTYDPATRGGSAPDGRKVKGTLHWVSDSQSVPAEIRLYDRLFNAEFPGTGGQDYLQQINPNSLQVLKNCRVEPMLVNAAPETRFQFERQGYFCADRKDTRSGTPVFNRIVTLRDSWAKEKDA
jgi:glutaminyl-tRNA synthetase